MKLIKSLWQEDTVANALNYALKLSFKIGVAIVALVILGILAANLIASIAAPFSAS